MTPFIDTHCHIDTYEEMSGTSFAELWKTLDPKPAAFIHSACSPKEFEYAKTLPALYPEACCGYGVHPHYIDEYTPELDAPLNALLQLPRTVACGEIGLDYHYGKDNHEKQKKVFEHLLEIGIRSGKAITLHLREAENDSLAILKNAHLKNTKIHVHCFTSTPEFAEQLLALSDTLYIGFTGIISFKNADNVKEAARRVPLERLVLETDAPYLAPIPFRGKPAHPGMIPIIAEHLARIKEVETELLMEICLKNSKTLYGI
ncbi:MAG: TatD family hydrolase [Fibrobacter sp.]|jgi:TatD DNase family protein|nr:TatD family hydrolase [Fibrobacter sp.]